MPHRIAVALLGVVAAGALVVTPVGSPMAASTSPSNLAAPVPPGAVDGRSGSSILADVHSESPRTSDGDVRVIVQGVTVDAAARAVTAAGGTVERRLEIVNGVAAAVAPAHLAALGDARGVRAVTPNEIAAPMETTSTSTTAAPRSVFNQEMRVGNVRPKGSTGKGVTVALIDTGVARVPDLSRLDANGKIIGSRVVPVPNPEGPAPEPGQAPPMAPCANFSGEGSSDATGCRDDHGHGTFMAGLSAGNGYASGGRYTGVAPEASIADIKIGGATGAADVSKILAAIQYVVIFKDTIQPPVRVINLSLGTTSGQHYHDDPLNYAVQRAWTSGLAVIVSAGNARTDDKPISKPGDDPLVVTVGAVDDLDTPTADDDRLPHFTARGPSRFTEDDGTTTEVAKPDVVAPGAHVVSLRPVDANGQPSPTWLPAPSSTSWHTNHYRRGSGTSMSTALVSGVAALYAQHRGSSWGLADPDRLKQALVGSARPVASTDRNAVGAGLVDAPGTLSLGAQLEGVTPSLMSASGDGLLGISRGDAVVTTRPCTEIETLLYDDPLDPTDTCTMAIEGERTAQDKVWNADAYRGAFDGSSWYGSSWYGSSWYGSSWYGSSWYGSSWYGSSWYGSSWYGIEDDGTSGYGATVNGSSWYGAWD